MTCSTCLMWLLRRETRYESGDTIVNWSDPQGRGKCTGPLNGALTTPDFGCLKYQEGGPVIEVLTKSGEPWHHCAPGPCPDCKRSDCHFNPKDHSCDSPNCPGTRVCLGTGMHTGDQAGPEDRVSRERASDRGRCCGTGTVLYYDDGAVGNNRSKMHPREEEKGKRHHVQPTCFNCSKPIDLNWMACPFCGTRLQHAESGAGAILASGDQGL